MKMNTFYKHFHLIIFLLFQTFSQPDFSTEEGGRKIQSLVDVLLQVMLESPGFRVITSSFHILNSDATESWSDANPFALCYILSQMRLGHYSHF